MRKLEESEETVIEVKENADGAITVDESVEVVEVKTAPKTNAEIRALTVYPEPFLDDESVRHGGFIIYIAGKYSGIS